jgi:superoxide dismutase
MKKYELPPVPYPYDALEPHIDARTMEIHHTKHHQTYTDKLNAALEKCSSQIQEKDIIQILSNLEARLSVFTYVRQYELYIINKAHIEHPICLVKNNKLYIIQPD